MPEDHNSGGGLSAVRRAIPVPLKRGVVLNAIRLRALMPGDGNGGDWRGFCPACARRTRFAYRTRDVNDGFCFFCLSVARNRHLALTLLRHAGRGPQEGLSALKDTGLRIYVAAASGSTAQALQGGKNVTLSEYFDDAVPGETRRGILHQDIQSLTFADESFDMVVSEEVFEHVQNYRAGFREVWRVLRPGGAHIFTVPADPQQPKTLDRFRRGENGEMIPVLPLELHGDWLRGTIPAITSFGGDLSEIQAGLGFDLTTVESTREEDKEYGTHACRTFVAVKRANGSGGSAAAR